MLKDMYAKGVQAHGEAGGEGAPPGQTGEAPPAPKEENSPPSDTGAVDAEYTVVDDDK
jgi:hypothetical protein